MKTAKKYPLLISIIVSCVLVVASLFILGFFGINLGTSLAGGSQFEITLSNDADTKEYTAKIKEVVSNKGYIVDSAFVEDKYKAGDEDLEFTDRCLVVSIASKNISDADKKDIRTALAEKLEIDVEDISAIEKTTSALKAKSVLFLGIAVAIIVVCLFAFGWLRYSIFAGLSFILAYLHNIILFLSMIILTRVQLNLISLASIVVLTLVMTAVLIVIYEKYREQSRLKTAEKQTIAERMIACEKTAVKPFGIIAGAIVVFALMMLFVPVAMVRFASLGMIIALLVTAYTTLVIGPASYVALLEIRNDYLKAIVSRNDTVNKEIQKKIKTASKKAEEKKNAETKVEKAETKEVKPAPQKKAGTKKSTASSKAKTSKKK